MFNISFSGIINNRLLKKYLRLYSSSNSNVLKILQNGNVGDKTVINGWIKSLRKQKEKIFIDLNDGTTSKKLQIIVPQKLEPDKLSTGSSITASGILNRSPKGQLELTAEKIKVCGKCVLDEGYPFAPRKQYAPEYIRQHLHFRPRTSKFSSLLRLRHRAVLAIHNCFNSNGYINIHTPVLTSNDCEGAGEIFKVVPDSENLLKSMAKDGHSLDEAYFDQKVFLTVSGQLQLEAAAHSLSKVYTLGPTFRAENSRSRLHLSEFYMLEAEIAFLNNLQDLIEIIEKLVKNVTKMILEQSMEDVELCYGDKKPDFTWLDKKFPVITYDDAINIIKNSKKKIGENFDEEADLSKEHELFLVEYFENIPTFVINWPKESKPFYMKESEADSTKVAALDLLAPGVGEIVGGSLREDDYEKLKAKLPQNSKDSTQLNWYLDLRKFGGVPTGGFGLGFERYLLFILGINNIKDTIPFPRWPHNCRL